MRKDNPIKEFCDLHGLKITYKPYRMWHSVPHIGNTALVIDEYVIGGGQRIITDPRHFPGEITAELVGNAVWNHAYSLGRLIWNNSSGRDIRFIPWSELIEDYPPGFTTRRIGQAASAE